MSYDKNSIDAEAEREGRALKEASINRIHRCRYVHKDKQRFIKSKHANKQI